MTAGAVRDFSEARSGARESGCPLWHDAQREVKISSPAGVCACAVTETTMHASMSAMDFIAAVSPLPFALSPLLPTYRSVGESIAYHLIYRYASITSSSRPRRG